MTNVVAFRPKRGGSEPPKFLRWQAIITYRTDGASLLMKVAFEELEDLHNIVEQGPNWNCLETIVICLNPELNPEKLTLEEPFQ